MRVLKDGEATRDDVDRALEWLFQNATSNDRLAFFFSGHGCRFEKGGVIEEALVMQDGRLLTGHHLVDRMASLPAGIFTAVLDCCFSGLDELLLHPTGEIEVARAKRWLPVDTDRGRPERLITHGTRALTPFGHVKPVTVDAMAMHVRGGTVDPTPPHPEHLAVRAFLTFQPVLFVYPSQGPGAEADASVAEAVRAALFNMQEGRSMHATMPGTQTQYGDELGTIVNTVTPIVASVLQSRAWQPYGGYQQYGGHGSLPFATGGPGLQGWQGQQGGFGGFQGGFGGQQGWHGAFGQRGQFDEIAQLVSAVVPAVLTSLQGRGYQQPFAPGFQFQSPMGGGLPPQELAQIVSTVTPIVTSLIQARSYQGQFGQFMPRAA